MKATRASARRIRHGWLIFALAAVLLSTFAFGGSSSASTAYDPEEMRFLGLINDYREENGLRPLVLSDTLTVASERHAKDMAEYDFFAHNTQRSSYYPANSEPWDRMEAEGYDYNTAKGENLAVGYETAEEAMQAWKKSSSHNAAMLDGKYRVMGVARINAPGSVHGWYWTTDFGGLVDPSARTGPENAEPVKPQQPAQKAPEGVTDPPPSGPREGVAGPVRDTGALENGAMGKAGSWVQKARDGADLVLDDGYARLGGYHDGADDLRQKIRVTPGSSLAYDVKVRTRGGEPADRMLVRLIDGKGEQVAVLKKYTGREPAGWERERIDLSRFEGRTLFLSFHARTDAERLTTVYLDRAALKPQESGP